MEAKLKAKELVEKFTKQPIHAATLHMVRNKPEFRMDYQSAKQCALIVTKEVLLDKMILGGDYKFEEIKSAKFWEQVKNEIQQL